MQNNNMQFLIKKIFSLLLFFMLSALLFAQNTKFPQSIKWRSDKNAYYYKVELQSLTTGKSEFIKTDKNSLELSLQPGKYRYRVYVFDLLGRESGVNNWTDFEILKASKPEITLIDKKVYIPADGDYFNINARITGVSSTSKVLLINEQTGHEAPGELVLQTDSKSGSETANAVRARFYYVRPGKWHLKITNSSGYSTDSESFEIIDLATSSFVQIPQEEEKSLESNDVINISEEEIQKRIDEAVGKALEEERLKNNEILKEKEKEIEEIKEKSNKALNLALSSQAKKRGRLELGMYVKDYVPKEHMENHAVNFLGSGFSLNINFLPQFRVNPGLCIHLDGETVMANLDYVEEWYSGSAFTGLFLELCLGDYFSIVPSVEGGLYVDYVRATVTDNELYFSPAFQGSLGFKYMFNGRKSSGLAIEISPCYIAAFEKEETAHFIGGKVGFVYNIGRKSLIKTDKFSLSSADRGGE